mgnify:CR=1 FL=1
MQHSDTSPVFRSMSSRIFVVVISGIIIFILMDYFLSRADQEMAQLERGLFELRLSELNAAVIFKQASLVAKDDMASAKVFAGANPMDWLEADAKHYLGEMGLDDASNFPGNWVFDPEQKVIAYLPRNFEAEEYHLTLKRSGQKYVSSVETINSESHSRWLRFKVVALWSKDNKEIERENIQSLVLQALPD